MLNEKFFSIEFVNENVVVSGFRFTICVCECVYMYLLTQNSSYEYLPYFKFNVHHNGIEEYDFSIVVDFLFFFFFLKRGRILL